jgi:hypothetical protein
MTRRFSLPYSPDPNGYWLPVTATINWCEEDYYATRYAAEFVNAFTNLLFFSIGVKGVLSCRRNGHDGVFHIAYLGYLTVGLGSFLFHATLKCKYSSYTGPNREQEASLTIWFCSNRSLATRRRIVYDLYNVFDVLRVLFILPAS